MTLVFIFTLSSSILTCSSSLNYILSFLLYLLLFFLQPCLSLLSNPSPTSYPPLSLLYFSHPAQTPCTPRCNLLTSQPFELSAVVSRNSQSVRTKVRTAIFSEDHLNGTFALSTAFSCILLCNAKDKMMGLYNKTLPNVQITVSSLSLLSS